MVSVGSFLKSIDNSGAKEVQCLKILGNSFGKYAYAGDIIIVSLIKINPLKKLKKGEVHRAVVVCTKKSKIRFNGIMVSFGFNGVVIINQKNLPIASRILNPVMVELRSKNFLKILSMAAVAI